MRDRGLLQQVAFATKVFSCIACFVDVERQKLMKTLKEEYKIQWKFVLMCTAKVDYEMQHMV